VHQLPEVTLNLTTVPQVKSLACSSDSSVLILGGGTDVESGKPWLAAVTFDQNMTLIHETEFDLEGLSTVYSLRT